METKDYIKNITKASAYFVFRNGPVKKLYDEGKLTDEEVREMQEYLQDHLAYLYDVLLDQNNLQKFELITTTMNNFYVNDDSDIKMNDGGFELMYEGLFGAPKKTSSIEIKK